MRIAFCAFGLDQNDLVNHAEFYRQDLELLRSLGHDVVFVRHPLMLRRSFDVAFVWWWNYLWLWGPWARLVAVPLMTTGVFDLRARGRWHAWKQSLKAWGAQFSQLHVFISREEAASVPRAIRLPADRVRYSPLCVDTAVYSPAAVVVQSDKPFTVLNIAWQRLSNVRRKMLLELLEAFSMFRAEVPDARLTMAGRPEDGAAVLKSRAVELGIHDAVDFMGEVSREQKVSLMRQCSLYCQVSRYEGFGLAIAEAMACGAPVLVSSEGAVPEVVGDCGTYVPATSVAGILEGLRECHARIQEKRALAARAVERVRNEFSLERRRADLAGCLEQLRKPAG